MSGSDLRRKLAEVVAAMRPEDEVVDPAFEPARATSALAAGKNVWLRALPEPGEPSGDGYGPAPRDPTWIRVTKGTDQVEVVSHGPRAEAAKARATALDVSTTQVSWGTPAAPLKKHLARGRVTLDPGGSLTVVAAITDDARHARAAVATLLGPLGAALGVDVAGMDDAGAESTHDATPRGSSSDVARELARFTFGWEGDRRVLRDLAHPGPRASGWIWTTVALASAAGAVATLVQLLGGLRAGAGWMSLAPQGGVAVVFALGAFAFFHVARHALRYRASGTPIAVFADDRVVVMPWVRRDGAIDPKPESRFGAGVRVAEIRKVEVALRDGVATVSLDTEHGPIDVAGGLGADALEVLRDAIENAGASIAAPRRKTAIMRARERTQRAPTVREGEA